MRRLLASLMMSSTLALAALTLAPAPSALARPVPDSFADLVQTLQPAVVNISTTQQVEVNRSVRMFPELPPGHPLEDFFRRMPQQGPRGQDGEGQRPITREARSLGSGFIIDGAGFVVTNNHVITGPDQDTPVDRIKVTLSDGTEYDAKLVGRDRASDLALLKIEPKSALPTVRFGDSNKVRVGDWALAIGNPFGLGGSVTAGIVSALHRDIEASQFNFFIQTDASINRGNSGGPMFNMAGEVIGINTAIYSPTGGNVGIGFAIPSSYADNIIGQLRAAGRVKRGWLGVRIQQVTEEIAESLGLQGSKGAIVASVEGDTPASRAGVRANDVIVAFDGKPVNTSSELPLIVSETPIGRTVDLDIVRNGKPVRLRVTVAELPGGDPARLATREEPKQEREAPNESTAARQNLGITLTPLTDELRRRMGLERNDTGVVISSLNPASDAAAKGLRPGDIITEINGVAVRNPDQAAAEVDKVRAAKRNSVLLRVRRDRDFFVLGVRLMPLEEKPGQAR